MVCCITRELYSQKQMVRQIWFTAHCLPIRVKCVKWDFGGTNLIVHFALSFLGHIITVVNALINFTVLKQLGLISSLCSLGKLKIYQVGVTAKCKMSTYDSHLLVHIPLYNSLPHVWRLICVTSRIQWTVPSETRS